MKISDFMFQYETWNRGKARGLCRVRIFHTIGDRVAVVLTDLTSVGHGATGPSVTNSVELIFGALVRKGLIPSDSLIIEHYERSAYRGATFDLVSFSKTNAPSWISTTADDAYSVLGCDGNEFDAPTDENPKLLAEIERLRNAVDPFSGSPYQEDPEIINRRADIEAKMVSKGELIATIESGAGEKELQRLLVRDLSLIAEIYADPDEQYICFSEFPVGDGFVDFVLFSGCSRMDVILIEIKGADFNLVNGDSYRNFSSKANEAIQQIRSRVGTVYRDMEKFRNLTHSIRMQVESGKSLYGSFCGPYKDLQVDPDKDINIRCVVIAGRTKDDLMESRLRHDYEWAVKPPVRIETWDSWSRKLRRL